MTNPTLTYEHGVLYDCNSLSGWVEVEDGNVGTTTVENDDLFKMVITESGGNKVYYQYSPLGLGLASNTYKKIVYRYRTSDSTIKAKIDVVFTAGSQTVLAESSSTSLTTGTVTITPDKTIDHVRLYANQATGTVWYDFALICQNIFTFPFVRPGGVRLRIPDADVSIGFPGRVGDVKHYVGEDSPIIEITGEMDTNTDWVGTLNIIGEYVYRIVARRNLEEWQWFTSDLINCKVRVGDVDLFQYSEAEALRVYSLTLKQFERTSGSNFSWHERFGL